MVEHITPPVADYGKTDFTIRRFNHDLLTDPEDQGGAARRWPLIAQTLIDLDLIKAFKPHEQSAKRLKLATMTTGSVSIVLTFIALFVATLHILSELQHKQIDGSTLRILGAICAVLSLLCALLSSRYGPFRRRWLKNRFLTEVFRQWHFRHLLDGVAISELLVSGQDAFVNRHHSQFLALLEELKGTVGQKMDQLIEERCDPLGYIQKPQLPNHPGARAELLQAYRVLRIDHQREFAVYKLSADDRTLGGLSSHMLVQVAGFLAAVTIMLALVCSIGYIFFEFTWLPLTIVSLPIAGVAIRAWRDGLALGEERERYQDMRHRLELLTARWEAATTDDHRLLVAEEVEQAALEELRSFIRTHERAQFLF